MLFYARVRRSMLVLRLPDAFFFGSRFCVLHCTSVQAPLSDLGIKHCHEMSLVMKALEQEERDWKRVYLIQENCALDPSCDLGYIVKR